MMYTSKLEVVRVVDGDTLIGDVDLGYDVCLRGSSIRLYGINTPESRGLEKDAGKLVSDYLEYYLLLSGCISGRKLLSDGSIINIDRLPLCRLWMESPINRDSFGRLLGNLYLDSGISVSKLLLDKGLAHEYKKGSHFTAGQVAMIVVRAKNSIVKLLSSFGVSTKDYE